VPLLISFFFPIKYSVSKKYFLYSVFASKIIKMVGNSWKIDNMQKVVHVH